MSAAQQAISISHYTLFIGLSGLMGLFGQGIRAVVGLNKSGRLSNADQNSTFDAAFMLISLMIGVIAGILASFIIGIPEDGNVTSGVLLSIAAAGYAGADFVENTAGLVINRVPPTNKATGVSPANESVWVPVGQSTTLSISFLPAGASEEPGNWTSNNSQVATVNNQGLVTGASAGTAIMTFKTNNSGLSTTVTVTVTG